MSFWKNSVSSENAMPRGGYLRGSVSALVLGSIGFIILNTIFPIEPHPIMANSAVSPVTSATPEIPSTTAVIGNPVATSTTQLTAQPTDFSTTANFDGPATPSLGTGAPVTETTTALTEIMVGDANVPSIASPTIRTPAVGVTSSGALITTNLTSQGGAPTLPGGSRPTLLGESQTNGEINIASLDVSTARPTTGGFGATTQTIVAPTVNGSIQPPATQVASIGAIDPSLSSTVFASDGAFNQNSQLFNDNRSRALVSIILHVNSIEEAAASAGLAASVTLAVDADNPNAMQIITAYRQLGGETLLSMPQSGNLQLDPADNFEFVESKLKAMLPDDLNVIGIIDTSGASVPDNSALAESVIRVLSPWGHAIVTPGVSQTHSAQVAAETVGLPATAFQSSLTEFSDRNAMVQEINRIVRGLDTSAATSIYGNADQETLAALNSWLAGSQAGTVTMAPISASIRR